MESRLLKLERENSQLVGTVIQLKRKNEEQDKTINLLTEQNKRLMEVVSEVRKQSAPTVVVPRNDLVELQRTLLGHSGERSKDPRMKIFTTVKETDPPNVSSECTLPTCFRLPTLAYSRNCTVLL
jgi:hypothetical protein